MKEESQKLKEQEEEKQKKNQLLEEGKQVGVDDIAEKVNDTDAATKEVDDSDVISHD